MNIKKAAVLSAIIVTITLLGFFFIPGGLASAAPLPPALEKGNPTVNLPQSEQPVAVYLFWGDGCPHCARAKPFMASLAQKHPGMELREYEVWNNQENQAFFFEMCKTFGFEPSGVPTFFVGEKSWVGYNDDIEKEIQAHIESCLMNGCPDKGAATLAKFPNSKMNNPSVIEATGSGAEPTPVAVAAPVEAPEKPAGDSAASSEGMTGEQITVPFIGAVDLSSKSIWLSTLLISFVDGVNPCSIWVLTMLLAITLHAGSRKKVIIIGLIFLTVTAGIYALFIAGLFTMLTVINFVGWIQIAVALLSLFFAVINIKDYFWYKEGLSFTIADDKKPGIFQRMRRLMDASQSFWGLAGATVVMAAGVSLVEFSCTAGFPVLWTNILVSQNVTGLTFILLLLFYLIIYQLDEMVIFFTAVYSLKSSKLEEKHGRLLKLIGGMLMLALALVMIINPALMNNLGSSLWIFGAAFAGTVLVLFLHRFLLPKFGLRIGSEFETSKGKRTPRKRKAQS